MLKKEYVQLKQETCNNA